MDGFTAFFFAPIIQSWLQPGFWMAIVIVGTLSLFVRFRVWISLLITPIISFLAYEFAIPEDSWILNSYYFKIPMVVHTTWMVTVYLYLVDKALRKRASRQQHPTAK
ncbi:MULTISPECIES: hypothetical protein [Brevibacillus]|uniref:Uncharacterized protein n=1 Tax=Brevibacillus invocatus TaxID=173959 RepID=A0A3M8CJP5_9BACL|nr:MULTISPECIES: hypothetical protein [Brevibacillus]MCM3429596.1 hypothetical protein [Brevibacillus invocatus]MDH4619780.1 hypothetical protein [Brevibacillus sp. AY1]RNB75813.1 hypothetical protein EDM52_05175 [Brevibacillus invocatus]